MRGAAEALGTRVIRETLGSGRPVRLTVRGRSMSPLIPDGRWVEARALCRGEPRVGDLVLVELGPLLALHRVVERSQGWVRTRGDRAALPDQPVRQEAVLGVVSRVEGLRGLSFPAPRGPWLGRLARGAWACRRAMERARRG